MCVVVGFDIAEGFVDVTAYFFECEVVYAGDACDFAGVVDADV